MFREILGKYAHEGLGFGDKLMITNNGSSSTPVPPSEGEAYRKSPLNNDDTLERRKDLFFFGQVYSLVGESVFRRLDLDAGRLNRLWRYGILLEVDRSEAASSNRKRFRLSAAVAAERFADVLGNDKPS